MTTATAHVSDITTDAFETAVLERSMTVPVLIDLWAPWCGPCKTLGPMLEKLAGEYNGSFELAKVDVDKEPQIAGDFQVRSIPAVFLMVNGEIVDGFTGLIPEGQIRQFLATHSIQPGEAVAEVAAEAESEVAPVVDPHADVMRLRREIEADPEKAELKLDLALALLKTGAATEAGALIDALPANLATDERTLRARARIDFATQMADAPPVQVLQAAVDGNPDDLRARHLLGIQYLMSGQEEGALEQFIEMLRRDRAYEDGLPKKTLIDAFRVVEDEELVGRYRRKMSSLLF